MVEGIFAFEDHGFHWRAERRMQVRKFRASQIIRGQHTFCISIQGLRFFPRLESLPLVDANAKLGKDIVSTGLSALDNVLLAHGLFTGSSSLVMGHTGPGKTGSGALAIKNLGHEDESMDEMGHKLLRLVDELKIRRLVVDGLAGLADTLAAEPPIRPSMYSCLSSLMSLSLSK